MTHIHLSKVYFTGALLLTTIHFSNAEDNVKWKANFGNSSSSIQMGESREIYMKIECFNKTEFIELNASIRLASDWNNVRMHQLTELEEITENKWNGVFTVDAIFIGNVRVFVEIVRRDDGSVLARLPQQLLISVKRHKCDYREIKQFLKYIFIIFNFILYTNFGLVLDLAKVKAILRNPLRNLIAYLCNFIVMPLVSFFIILCL